MLIELFITILTFWQNHKHFVVEYYWLVMFLILKKKIAQITYWFLAFLPVFDFFVSQLLWERNAAYRLNFKRKNTFCYSMHQFSWGGRKLFYFYFILFGKTVSKFFYFIRKFFYFAFICFFCILVWYYGIKNHFVVILHLYNEKLFHDI